MPQPDGGGEQRQRRPRQCAVGRRGVQFVLPGLVAEAQQARAEEVDDQAQQQHDARDEPPAAVGDGLLEDHQLGEEQRRGREGHQHDHPREQSHGPHAVDVDVVADAVDAVVAVDLPHDGDLEEQAALDERMADDVEHARPRRRCPRCPARWPRCPCSRPWSRRGSVCSCWCGAGTARPRTSDSTPDEQQHGLHPWEDFGRGEQFVDRAATPGTRR